ncbi:hypothetical protein JCM19000A_14370 [Silvimonas sp. JCM 19000]
MGERLNFICVGDRMLSALEHRSSIEQVLSRFKGPIAAPVEVMRIDGRTGAATVLPWDSSAQLVEAPLESGALLFTYFVVGGNDAAGRQSVSLDSRQNESVITLSLHPRLVSAEAQEAWSASWVLAQLAGWAMETFEHAALACGPELDLYELGEERDLRRIEERLSSDQRCWLSMSVHRFSKRMTSIDKNPGIHGVNMVLN